MKKSNKIDESWEREEASVVRYMWNVVPKHPNGFGLTPSVLLHDFLVTTRSSPVRQEAHFMNKCLPTL